MGQWLDHWQAQLLPTAHFHVIFTLPHELHVLWRWNRPLLTEVLFRSVRETLLTLLHDPKWLGATPGISAALYTWSRTLAFHAHVPCLVSGGGLTVQGQWRAVRNRMAERRLCKWPSGLIRTPGIGTSVKMWGAYSGAVGGRIDVIAGTILVKDTYPKPVNKCYRYCYVDRINIPNQGGDSGALVAYEGTGNRHVAGIFFASPLDSVTLGAWFTKAFDIQRAFINASRGFHYYWRVRVRSCNWALVCVVRLSCLGMALMQDLTPFPNTR
jgi:hypothetical protein